MTLARPLALDRDVIAQLFTEIKPIIHPGLNKKPAAVNEADSKLLKVSPPGW